MYEAMSGVGAYVISYKIDEKEKSVSFDRIRASINGGQHVDVRCPEIFVSVSDYRELGTFYGMMNESFPFIFDVGKINAAIN